MSEILTTKNRFNITIVKCCANCIHNIGAHDDTRRICGDGEGIVKLTDICASWAMRPALDNAGVGGGKVKSKQYLDFVRTYPQPENPKFHIPLKEIRAEYQQQFGSIYINRT